MRRLHLGEDAPYFGYLQGCGVEVTGVRFGKHVWVDTWSVVDAGDGSAPFLGILNERYDRWILHDINTDTEIELLMEEIEAPWRFQHRAILVTGIVVGPHQVRVMNVKVLEKMD